MINNFIYTKTPEHPIFKGHCTATYVSWWAWWSGSKPIDVYAVHKTEAIFGRNMWHQGTWYDKSGSLLPIKIRNQLDIAYIAYKRNIFDEEVQQYISEKS